MKKSVVLLCCLLTCVGLTACQGKGASSKGEECGPESGEF